MERRGIPHKVPLFCHLYVTVFPSQDDLLGGSSTAPAYFQPVGFVGGIPVGPLAQVGGRGPGGGIPGGPLAQAGGRGPGGGIAPLAQGRDSGGGGFGERLGGLGSSTIAESALMETIIAHNARVASAKSPAPSHPKAIAAAPTCADTVPYVKASTMETVAPAERCCQKADRKAKSVAMSMQASAMLVMGRDGNGFTSRSLPSEFSSVCQAGNVSNNEIAKRAKTMDMNLLGWLARVLVANYGYHVTHMRPLKIVPSWNLSAVDRRLRGSVEMSASLTIVASVLTSGEHTADPSSPSMRQKPK